MRKFLSQVESKMLVKIASDMLGGDYDRANVLNNLVEYFKSYGLNVADVKSRYPELN
jgi:hypothetical protein